MTTTTTPTAFGIHAIPRGVLDEVRTAGLDVSGNPVVEVRAGGGEPLRCCLRDADSGEHLMLFGYEPPLPPSPYREVGAIFAHRQPCDGPAVPGAYPAAWKGRPQVLRGYDDRGWIQAAIVHDGQQPETALAEVLGDPEVVVVHSRNVAYGCFMFMITPEPRGQA